MKIEIIKVWICGDTDGYSRYFREGRAVLTEAESKQYTAKSGYCVSEERWAIKVGNDYYLLEGGCAKENEMPEPLTIGIDTEPEKKRIKREALKKLTRKELEVLGIKE